MVPKPMPRSKAIAMKKNVVHAILQLASHPQALNERKQKFTNNMPTPITWVIMPLSTNLPENKRDTAIPTAISVKKKPEEETIPICLAYMAT